MKHMAVSKIGKQIDDLIDAEQWEPARALIEKALKKEPQSHWLLTQLGETYYEERQYKTALDLLLRSRDILPGCPLTLWHLANTLDALGHSGEAVRLYTWLLRSKNTAKDDPCWESSAWADALKTDCVYRLGLCFKHLARNGLAAYCIRKYLALLAVGSEGSYSIDDARGHLQELHENKRAAVEQELQEALDRVLESSSEEKRPATEPPDLDSQSLRQLQEV
jgi:tetratricopeptide (TPR) repeat protein